MIGSYLGQYRVTGELGRGGMGEVWRAADARLGREVALKLLPEGFADDPERLARFEREARVLASLNHPNIATLYGLETALLQTSFADVDGEAEAIVAPVSSRHGPSADPSVEPVTPAAPEAALRLAQPDTGAGRRCTFLVMELVEGEGLDDLIARGAIPVAEALPFARQIAEALEAAHEAGIVHRDLKPANIRVRPDGAVKVLDFGLAKAWECESGGGSDLSLSPTMTRHGTAAGVILGTASYMSPEQARGKPVDRRADIWAFGVVLWEMLTGRSLFAGDTVSDILAAVLRESPDLAALPPTTPRPVRQLLWRCLERDPRRRLRDIGEARLVLDDVLAGVDDAGLGLTAAAGGPASPAASRWRRLVPWTVAVAAGALAVSAWLGALRRTAPLPRLTASIVCPAAGGFDADGGMALGPDGTNLVFAAFDEAGRSELWLHDLGRGEARVLAGTAGAKAPFWSPDGRHIAFFADGGLHQVDVGSGVVETLADQPQTANGAAWSPRGSIVFSLPWTDRMQVLAPAGGPPDARQAAADASDELLLWPTFLPDGNHYLYLARSYSSLDQSGEIRVASLDDPTPRVLLKANSNALYADPGWLLWWREGNLRAQRFDPGRLELSGESVVVVPDVRFDPGHGRMAVTVARRGPLVLQRGNDPGEDELVLLDRQGSELAEVAGPGSYYGPRLSPDGRQVVSDVSDATNRGDLWLFDLTRGTKARLTSFGEDETRPRWSAAGDRVVYSSMVESDLMALWVADTKTSASPRLLAADPGAHLRVTDWSSTGLVLLDRPQGQTYDLYVYDPANDSLRPWLATRFDERSATASPDGAFAAYVSDDSGRAEVWIRRFPSGDGGWRVSIDGGDWPSWRADGAELYYVAPDGWLTAVPVRWQDGERGRAPDLGTPLPLFRFRSKSHTDRQYDTHDGERFLVNRSVRTGTDTPLTLIQGWRDALTAPK